MTIFPFHFESKLQMLNNLLILVSYIKYISYNLRKSYIYIEVKVKAVRLVKV